MYETKFLLKSYYGCIPSILNSKFVYFIVVHFCFLLTFLALLILSLSLSSEKQRSTLNSICGVVSERTKRLCTRSVKCPQHTEEQRKEIRTRLLSSSSKLSPLGKRRPSFQDEDSLNESNNVYLHTVGQNRPSHTTCTYMCIEYMQAMYLLTNGLFTTYTLDQHSPAF